MGRALKLYSKVSQAQHREAENLEMNYEGTLWVFRPSIYSMNVSLAEFDIDFQ